MRLFFSSKDINYGEQLTNKKRKFDILQKSIRDENSKEYVYLDLLDRLIENLKKNGMETEKKERLVISPPKVNKEGTKKTIFLNFKEICLSLNREKEHLLLFISSELGVFASIQNGGGLVLKGRYQPKGIENILRNYINEYVLCGSCKGAETILKKDSLSRLFFILCNRCQASRSVNPIRQGYMAQTKRKKFLK
mmetsp:Transcript_45734/g.91537  ORF Transcript_45734/g.91537 Transcript_45734/m.91537 type:complete len:194 (+) Transcript_45734:732-1313(+)